MPLDPAPLTVARLDVWLDVACLFKTRSEAQRACQAGKVELEGQRAKAHRDIKVGQALVISRPFGRKQHVVVRALADRHIPKAEARALYDDVTPPPTAGEQAMLDLVRLARQFPPPAAPDKRARRTLRRIKEGRER